MGIGLMKTHISFVVDCCKLDCENSLTIRHFRRTVVVQPPNLSQLAEDANKSLEIYGWTWVPDDFTESILWNCPEHSEVKSNLEEQLEFAAKHTE